MARVILGQSSCDPVVVAQAVRDAHRFFWVSLETEEPAHPVCDSTIFLQTILCFLWEAAEVCLAAWERTFKPDNEELVSWSRTCHQEALGSHAGSPS